MESTGIYWIQAFEILESYGFEVFLVNAREANNVPEDVKLILMMLNGFSDYINTDFYALVPISGNVNVCWHSKLPTFNIGKKP